MSIPYGTIVIWHGAVVDIPPGFHLCDGNNGTPDLRNQFIVCAGDAFNPGDNGGSNTHTHIINTVGHSHTLPAGTAFEIGNDYFDVTSTTAPSGSADERNHLPPYYSLCYIMRI